MKVASVSQIAGATFEQSLTGVLPADFWLRVSGKLRAPLFYVAAVMCGVLSLALLSVVVIGVMDRLGFAPQNSFGGLNLMLIAGCVLALLVPLKARRKAGRVALRTSGASAAAAAGRNVVEMRGKLLIIRRNRNSKPCDESQREYGCEGDRYERCLW